ncbi:MAG TPA: hypothetical protein VGG28_16130 [Kofleriaceae bacterium]|jgi:hypothetical protein
MKKYLFVALFSIAGVAYADHMRPPQAAFDACAKSKQGDSCSFTGKSNQTVNGTCQVPRHHADGSAAATLVCHAPHHDHGGGSGSGG